MNIGGGEVMFAVIKHCTIITQKTDEIQQCINSQKCSARIIH